LLFSRQKSFKFLSRVFSVYTHYTCSSSIVSLTFTASRCQHNLTMPSSILVGGRHDDGIALLVQTVT